MIQLIVNAFVFSSVTLPEALSHTPPAVLWGTAPLFCGWGSTADTWVLSINCLCEPLLGWPHGWCWNPISRGGRAVWLSILTLGFFPLLQGRTHSCHRFKSLPTLMFCLFLPSLHLLARNHYFLKSLHLYHHLQQLTASQSNFSQKTKIGHFTRIVKQACSAVGAAHLQSTCSWLL